MTLWLFGSIVRQPMAYAPYLSNTGCHVVPLLVLFHILPEATPAYISEWLPGLTARSAIRPEAHAGPTDLNEIPLYNDGETDGLILFSDSLTSFFASLFTCLLYT